MDEFPPPVEPVRIFVGVTVTLTASFFDCPLPSTKMPCTNAKLGNSPMECTWIKQTGGGEVRLIGTPLEPTLGDPKTNFAYKFPVSFTIDGLQYSYGIAGGFGSTEPIIVYRTLTLPSGSSPPLVIGSDLRVSFQGSFASASSCTVNIFGARRVGAENKLPTCPPTTGVVFNCLSSAIAGSGVTCSVDSSSSVSVFIPNATSSLPPPGSSSQLLIVDVFIDGVGYFRTNSANLVKNFVKLNVIAGNTTMDQYSGFRTITLCPSSQLNPPCSALRVTLTKLPASGSLYQPLMVAGLLFTDKRGTLISSANSVVLPSITATGSVTMVQYLPRAVGMKPVAGAIWDSLECDT